MRPVLVSRGRFVVHSYPAMLYAGLVTGVLAGMAAARSGGLDELRAYAALLALMTVALAGARLLYVATHWRVYARAPRRVWRRSEGGAAMYGGLLLALPVSVPLLAALSLPFGRFWDAATYTLLIGMAWTRVGCFLNGCCSGRVKIPTQLLELALALALLGACLGLRAEVPFRGALFLVALGGYALGRIALEETRASRARLQQALSAAFVLACAAVLAAGALT